MPDGVTQFCKGESLENYVKNQGILSETDALRYIQQISKALIEVHKKGLLHRDVKPGNIMLRSDRSQAVLIDFGIVREFTPDETKSHTAQLSDGFAPPEQYFRKRKRGAYTDVYATAATLYFMVTGKMPPPALDRSDGEQLVSPKQMNVQISDRTNEAILKGMELEVSDQPQSMQEWLNLLESPKIITPPVKPVKAPKVPNHQQGNHG